MQNVIQRIDNVRARTAEPLRLGSGIHAKTQLNTGNRTFYKPPLVVIETGEACPKCAQGRLLLQNFTAGKLCHKKFIGCSRHPQCFYFSWIF
jgi:ssDNA-binding Zn-finger/Zn-ribbon topoisomerase 1